MSLLSKLLGRTPFTDLEAQADRLAAEGNHGEAKLAYERALATDATGVSSVAKKAIALADEVGDTALLEEVFSKNVGLDVDDATRSRMAYLAAREAHHRKAVTRVAAWWSGAPVIGLAVRPRREVLQPQSTRNIS